MQQHAHNFFYNHVHFGKDRKICFRLVEEGIVFDILISNHITFFVNLFFYPIGYLFTTIFHHYFYAEWANNQFKFNICIKNHRCIHRKKPSMLPQNRQQQQQIRKKFI